MSVVRASLLVASCLLSFSSAFAQEFKGPCPVGARVTDRENKTGMVVSADASMCRVEFADGSKRSYLFWMLRPAGTARVDPKAAASVKLGRYACYTGSTFGFDIHVRSDSQYADRTGATGQYRYDASTRTITFESGSLQGTYSKYLGDGKLGLSSRKGGSFSTVCNVK